MTRKTRASKAAKLLMPSDFYERTDLLLGESREGYVRLVKEVMVALHPFDFFEEIWMGEYIDLSWEIFRLRDAKSKILNLSLAKAIRSARPIAEQEAKKLETMKEARISTREGCLSNETDPEIGEFLSSLASTDDMRILAAQFMEQNLSAIERSNDAIAQLQGRRDAILREVNRHRLNFAPVRDQLKAAQYKMVQAGLQTHDERTKNTGQSCECKAEHRPEDDARQSPRRT